MQVLLTDVELCCRRRSSAAGEHFQRHRRVVSCACGLLQQLQCHGDAGRTLQNVFSIPIFSRSRVEVSVFVPKAREFSSQISVRSDVCSFGAWRRDHITPNLLQLHWLHARADPGVAVGGRHPLPSPALPSPLLLPFLSPPLPFLSLPLPSLPFPAPPLPFLGSTLGCTRATTRSRSLS